MKAIEHSLEDFCRTGDVVDELCVTPVPPVLNCPENFFTACTDEENAEASCCAKGETISKSELCRDGSKEQDGTCKRIIVRPAKLACPPHHALGMVGDKGLQCILQETGGVSATCRPPDTLSPEGDACIATVEEGFQYVCPEGYQCSAAPLMEKKHEKKKGNFCASCLKLFEAEPKCACPDGEEESEGFCFESGALETCRARRQAAANRPGKGVTAPPGKAAVRPPGKATARPPGKAAVSAENAENESSPEVKCKPLSRILCTCEETFMLSCSGSNCTCIKKEEIPVNPECRGTPTESGGCTVQVQKAPYYECAEGFSCEVVDKHGRCTCVNTTSVEPHLECDSGLREGDKCIEIVNETKTLECPPGFAEACISTGCSCMKTILARRIQQCPLGAVSIQGLCATVATPFTGCRKGELQGEKCIQNYLVPAVCE